MLSVVLNSVFVVVGVLFTHFHVIDTNAVVGEGLTVHITDGAANLQELFILSDGLLVFAQVIVKDTSGVVGAALIPRLASTFASECKHFIVLKTLLGRDSIVRVRVAHLKTTVISQHLLVQLITPKQRELVVKSKLTCR